MPGPAFESAPKLRTSRNPRRSAIVSTDSGAERAHSFARERRDSSSSCRYEGAHLLQAPPERACAGQEGARQLPEIGRRPERGSEEHSHPGHESLRLHPSHPTKNTRCTFEEVTSALPQDGAPRDTCMRDPGLRRTWGGASPSSEARGRPDTGFLSMDFPLRCHCLRMRRFSPVEPSFTFLRKAKSAGSGHRGWGCRLT
jgi:hypothetical protein